MILDRHENHVVSEIPPDAHEDVIQDWQQRYVGGSTNQQFPPGFGKLVKPENADDMHFYRLLFFCPQRSSSLFVVIV